MTMIMRTFTILIIASVASAAAGSAVAFVAMLERWSFIGFLALLVYAAGYTGLAYLYVYYARNEEELRQS